MTSRVRIASLVAATLIGATALTSAVVYATEASQHAAADKSDAVQSNSKLPKAVVKDFLKLSQDGRTAMSYVHAARLSIYNGEEDAALKHAEKAQSLTAQAEADATTLDKIAKVDDKADASDQTASDQAAADNTRVVPIDAQISIEDDYGLQPAASDHLQKAKAAMKQGDNKTALEHVALIDRNVTYTYAAVPFDGLKANVDKAVQALKDKEYQSANLALKAVEDSVIINQLSVDRLPQTAPAS